MTKQIDQMVSNVLTETKAPTTKGSPASPASWPQRLGLQTFQDPILGRLVAETARFYEAYSAHSEPRWLTILGSSGNGKTHCLDWLWRALSPDADWSCAEYTHRRIYWPDFVDILRDGDCYGQFNDMKRWPLLALDDIGAERDPNGFSADKLNSLLGSRVGRWTIMTANLTLEELERLDRRITSRVIRKPNVWIENTAKDFSLR